MLQYLLARAKEPSSYAGLASLLGLVGINLAPEQSQAIIAVLAAFAAALSVFLPEIQGQHSRAPQPQPTPASSASAKQS